MVRLGPAALAALAVLSACAQQVATPIAEDCTAEVPRLREVLAPAPGQVVTAEGTPLSRCIADGQDDAELQSVGLAFSRVAERLRRAARGGDEDAAVQLGYLIGATKRGAARTNGVMLELQRRIELVGGRLIDDVPSVRAAVERGLAAGEASG